MLFGYHSTAWTYLQLNSSLPTILDWATTPLTLKANHVGSFRKVFLARTLLTKPLMQTLQPKPLLLGPCVWICCYHNKCRDLEKLFYGVECSAAILTTCKCKPTVCTVYMPCTLHHSYNCCGLARIIWVVTWAANWLRIRVVWVFWLVQRSATAIEDPLQGQNAAPFENYQKYHIPEENFTFFSQKSFA